MRELTQEETAQVSGGGATSQGFLINGRDFGYPGGLSALAALSKAAHASVHGQLGDSVGEAMYAGS